MNTKTNLKAGAPCFTKTKNMNLCKRCCNGKYKTGSGRRQCYNGCNNVLGAKYK